jgi:signal transduction histidine kinase
MTLRAKLFLSFTFVIFVCLLLAGAGFLWVLQHYQLQARVARIAELSRPVAVQVAALERQGQSPAAIMDLIREDVAEIGLRVLILDPNGTVMADTGREFEGRQLDLNSATRSGGAVWVEAWGHTFAVVPAVSMRPFRGITSIVAVGTPNSSLRQGWLTLLPSLSLAGLGALAVSAGISWLLARSIAQPLAELTQAATRMAAGDFEQTVPVRGTRETIQLAEAFNQMSQEVSRSYRTLKNFLADVSHELRTPLTSVKGFAQALTEQAVSSPSEVAEAARIILDEADRMDRLVNDLLFLSRLEANQVPFNPEPVDLTELARTCLRRFERDSAGTIRFEFAADGPAQALVDPTRTEQVLTNLLKNAVQHTPAGGVVRVTVAAGDYQHRAGVWVRVFNSGSFIPPADREKIFERFYHRNHHGLGLGLAISREIVQAQGGIIQVDSDPESGTEFAIWHPAPDRPTADGAKPKLLARRT